MGKPIVLNLGCGFKKGYGMINVDAYEVCKPDLVHNLNVFPYPFPTNYADVIYMHHVLEHIPDWWGAFCECVRILKPGGTLEIRVPDESSCTALTYRDHHHVFSLCSFHGILDKKAGTNAWAEGEKNSVPVRLIEYWKVPHAQYKWMLKTFVGLKILEFCGNHMRNFIHEQVFIFQKADRRPDEKTDDVLPMSGVS